MQSTNNVIPASVKITLALECFLETIKISEERLGVFKNYGLFPLKPELSDCRINARTQRIRGIP